MSDLLAYKHPYVCTDAVVFHIHTQEADSYRKLPTCALRVLLLRRETEPFLSTYCLPGGFLDIDEVPEENVRRKLSDKAAVQGCFLEQLFTFCELERDPRARVISIAYLGLMNEEEAAQLHRGQWFDVEKTETGLLVRRDALTLTEDAFGFDHYRMIQLALDRLQAKIWYSDLVFHLLPPCFTLTQLQNVFEAIGGKKDTAANFRRKIAHLVQETASYSTAKGHRPAKLFTRKQD